MLFDVITLSRTRWDDIQREAARKNRRGAYVVRKQVTLRQSMSHLVSVLAMFLA
jgi:hypothetical protein